MSKINLSLDLNPETPFTQSQADALSSLIYAYSGGEQKTIISGQVISQTVVADAVKTDEAPKDDKAATTTATPKAKTAAQKKAEAAAKAEAEKNAEESGTEKAEAAVESETDTENEETVSADDIKLIVGKKVEKHRETIKSKLTEMGAESLPKFLAAGKDLAKFKTFLEGLD